MNIKYKVGSKVYLYGSKNIIESKVIKIEVTENQVKYGVVGEYHHRLEEDLFTDVKSLLDDLKQNVQVAVPLKTRTRNNINETKDKLKNLFKK